ncbi:FKBP-type peptidyl-prolyl cis-trans isomerase [Gleimia hominis]|uniref:peptidylprolyl isomerase n=1 Tax=Gleimia hominis TaxID=595468 RepID=A0ABU3IBK0_9ACTO|nr:FKBP-type peptidyl-prolyl cis-trans isomerase [Gleimia hominis]MDT3767755.1 FKBP-type peptidyl-prolyl cis-trans isomerase [Gleimia hominis]
MRNTIFRALLVPLIAIPMVSACTSTPKQDEAKQTASPTASAPSDDTQDSVPVDRKYSGKLPEVSGEYAKSAKITPVKADEPKDAVVAKTLKKGDGDAVKTTDTVIAHYHGALWDGTVFDSSFERSENEGDKPENGGAKPENGAAKPIAFSLKQVIPGWTYGLEGQKVGDRVELVIPAKWGYGPQEQGKIPANSTLVFVVDIVGKLDTHDKSALKQGEAAKPKLPDGIKVEGKAGEKPTIQIDSKAKEPAKVEAITLIKGKGRVVTENDFVSYFGTARSWDGKQSVSDWDRDEGSASPQTVGKLIGFAGQTVGSRVLCLLPKVEGQSAQAVVVDITSAQAAK